MEGTPIDDPRMDSRARAVGNASSAGGPGELDPSGRRSGGRYVGH